MFKIGANKNEMARIRVMLLGGKTQEEIAPHFRIQPESLAKIIASLEALIEEEGEEIAEPEDDDE